ncbi:MAG: MerR family transcriptional regulator [Micromonosporaceae bacterium]
MTETGWTLDELVAHVATQLGDGRAGQTSRRVRELPDRRAIRWYTTIGLLDRPALRGRTGRYGRRHLLQLVAIKRLQAAGKPLAAIQAELAGATDATLRRITGISGEQLAGAPQPAPATPARRFWRTAPASTPATPAAATTALHAGTAATPAGHAAAAGRAVTRDGVRVRYTVELAEGVSLLLDTPPDPEDLPAVRASAQPLLDQLAGRTAAVPEGETP